MIQNESRDPFGGNVYYVTMQITFLTRKFRNGERNLHCDVVHITTKWVFRLTLDCNGVFAIKAYTSSSAGPKGDGCICFGFVCSHVCLGGPFKCYVTQMGVGGVCQNSQKKALRRCKVQRYLALRWGGWGSNFLEKSVT